MSFLKRLFKKPKKAELVERYRVETPDGRRVLVTRKLEKGGARIKTQDSSCKDSRVLSSLHNYFSVN